MQCQPSPLEFLSTPSARRATRRGRPGYARRRISIHALREEGDLASSWMQWVPPISIHALREEGDSHCMWIRACFLRFLSTPSARRATQCATGTGCHQSNFYPRPPRGGRLPRSTTPAPPTNFYPRPPRGGRRSRRYGPHDPHYFYPRPPRGGRRSGCCSPRHASDHFYPRPPRGGRRRSRPIRPLIIDFYPRPPRGGRPRESLPVSLPQSFLSTPSARRATTVLDCQPADLLISIHALREEGD